MNNMKIIKFNLFKKRKIDNDLYEKKRKKTKLCTGRLGGVGERSFGFVKNLGHFCIIKIYVIGFNFGGLMDSL